MADDATVAARVETAFDRIRRLEAEAHREANDLKNGLLADLAEIAARCGQVSTFTSLQPGVRNGFEQLARKIEDDLTNIQSIQVRAA